jgi:hypothetical protein
MKLFSAAVTLLAVIVLAGAVPVAGHAQDKSGEVKATVGTDAPTTIWILAYEPKNKSVKPEKALISKLVRPALDKLKDKGTKKIQIDVKYQHMYVWLEGTKIASLADIRAAFPELELKPIASAQFTNEAETPSK